MASATRLWHELNKRRLLWRVQPLKPNFRPQVALAIFVSEDDSLKPVTCKT
jgi:hypothetical protein